MGIWRDILILAASGNSPAARERLAREIPLELVRPFVAEDGSYQNGGPVPKDIRSFAAKLPAATQAKVRRYESELAEYILDRVTWKIEQTIRIVEICGLRPGIQLEDFVTLVPWTRGLKRSNDQKCEVLASLLRSMLERGVPLLDGVREMIGGAGGLRYRFDEIAYAASPTSVRQSWDDFKKAREEDSLFVSVEESESGVAAEGVDFGTITAARSLLEPEPPLDAETASTFERLARRLEVELPARLDEMHGGKPANGYRPLAWHSVFWKIQNELEALTLLLEVRDPCCEVDQDLADLIAAAYPDVVGASRPTVYRRRVELQTACKQVIVLATEKEVGRPVNRRGPGSHMEGEGSDTR